MTNTNVIMVVETQDKESNAILKAIEDSDEALETKEIETKLTKVSRSKILYRLNNLRAEGLINGKRIGAGKGTWIWWKKR